jgi:Cys-rich protein (TIGR01571 family)
MFSDNFCGISFRIVRESLGRGGIVLCIFGLLYGGFWRIRMRQRYNLPSKTWCCGQPNMTDCTQWLFCSCCSLCQEVRTAEAFDVIDDKFYARSQARAESPGHESAHQSVLLNPVPASSIQPTTPVRINDTGHSSEQQTTLTPPPAQSVHPEQ